MTKRPPALTTIVDGQTMYLLNADEYAALAQNRRQAGSLSTRLNAVRLQGRDDADTFDEIRALLSGHPSCDPRVECALCGIRAAVDRRDGRHSSP